MWLVLLDFTRLQLEIAHVHNVIPTRRIVARVPVARVRVLATQDMRAATTVSLVHRVQLDPTRAQVTWVAPLVLMVPTKVTKVKHLAWMSHRVTVAKLVPHTVMVMHRVVLQIQLLVQLVRTVWMVLAIVFQCPKVTTPLNQGQRLNPAEHSTTCRAPSAHTRMVTLAQPVAQAIPQQPLPHRR